MDLSSFASLVSFVSTHNEFFVAFVHCRIRYSGRAEAELDWGDRMIVLKQDNALLIHQPVNGNPINYIKPGAHISVFREEGCVIIEGAHPQTNDVVLCEVSSVYDAMSRRLEDGRKQLLAGTEADMSDYIRDNPQVISSDFTPLSREEHTKYGFIDVFGHDKQGTLVIVECKRYAASLACVTQLRRYVEKMKELRGTDNVTGVLASPKITPNAQAMLSDWGFSWARVEPPKRLLINRHQKTLADW